MYFQPGRSRNKPPPPKLQVFLPITKADSSSSSSGSSPDLLRQKGNFRREHLGKLKKSPLLQAAQCKGLSVSTASEGNNSDHENSDHQVDNEVDEPFFHARQLQEDNEVCNKQYEAEMTLPDGTRFEPETPNDRQETPCMSRYSATPLEDISQTLVEDISVTSSEPNTPRATVPKPIEAMGESTDRTDEGFGDLSNGARTPTNGEDGMEETPSDGSDKPTEELPRADSMSSCSISLVGSSTPDESGQKVNGYSDILAAIEKLEKAEGRTPEPIATNEKNRSSSKVE